MQFFDQLIHDQWVLLWSCSLLSWVVLSFLGHYVLLHRFNAQRYAEFLAVARWQVVCLLFFCLVLCGLEVAAVRSQAAHPSVYSYALIIALAILRIGVGVTLWSCFRPLFRVLRTEFVERYFRVHGKKRERNTAIVLIHLSQPLVLVLIVALILWLFNINVAGYVVGLSAVSLALAFALQSLLRNIFAGLSLALDAPFAEHDLIRLADGETGSEDTYQVISRGIRITTVKNVTTHEIVYLPNEMLADKALVDVTRPTDDRRYVIEVLVPYNADLRQVREILVDIANGHPHVVGEYASKKRAFVAKIHRLHLRRIYQDCKTHFIELARLEAEDELDKTVLRFKRRLESWAAYVDKAEGKGFDDDEKKWLNLIGKELRSTAREVATKTTIWQILFRNCTARARHLKFDVGIDLGGVRSDGVSEEVRRCFEEMLDDDDGPPELDPHQVSEDLTRAAYLKWADQRPSNTELQEIVWTLAEKDECELHDFLLTDVANRTSIAPLITGLVLRTRLSELDSISKLPATSDSESPDNEERLIRRVFDYAEVDSWWTDETGRMVEGEKDRWEEVVQGRQRPAKGAWMDTLLRRRKAENKYYRKRPQSSDLIEEKIQWLDHAITNLQRVAMGKKPVSRSEKSEESAEALPMGTSQDATSSDTRGDGGLDSLLKDEISGWSGANTIKLFHQSTEADLKPQRYAELHRSGLKSGDQQLLDLPQVSVFDRKMPYVQACVWAHILLKAAFELSDLVQIPPEVSDNREAYLAREAELKRIKETYEWFGKQYVDLMKTFVDWIVHEGPLVDTELKREAEEERQREAKAEKERQEEEEEERQKEDRDQRHVERTSDRSKATSDEEQTEGRYGFRISWCRNRMEDLHVGRAAVNHILDHPLLNAIAGRVDDDDERDELRQAAQVWGDKIDDLMRKTEELSQSLKRARSTTIDTQLREFARWLKEDFKDPTPTYKYPIAPVKGFAESGVEVRMIVYIDNVRMEKYLRPANAFTQFRLRILERLGNAEVTIPFPQRDLHVKSAFGQTAWDEFTTPTGEKSDTPK